MLEIQGKAALVAVHGHELSAHASVAKLTRIPPSVTHEGLDLDDLGAPIAQRLCRQWAEEDPGDVDNAYSFKWTSWLVHYRCALDLVSRVRSSPASPCLRERTLDSNGH